MTNVVDLVFKTLSPITDSLGDKRGRLCLQNLVSIMTPLGYVVDKLSAQNLVSHHASNVFSKSLCPGLGVS